MNTAWLRERKYLSATFRAEAGSWGILDLLMKILPFLLLAALVALFVLPVHFETRMSILSAIGVGAVLFTDYTRQARMARIRFTPVGAAAPVSTLRLAA